jgi:hypothetical protein
MVVERLVMRLLVAGLVLAGGTVGILGLSAATAATLASASTTSPPPPSALSSPPDWSTLEQQALGAVAGYQRVGPLAPTSGLSPAAASSFTLADGTAVPVVQRSVTTSDGQVLDLVLLGGRQLVVTAASSVGGAVVVLQPGSGQVSAAYPLAAGGSSNGPGAPVGTAAGGASAVLTSTPGNCYAEPGTPGVVGSVYGPLVMGVGEVICYSNNENISILASIDENGSQVSGTAGASGYTSLLQVAVYAQCTPVGWDNAFQTAQLWSINGTLEGGAVSPVAWLGCQ